MNNRSVIHSHPVEGDHSQQVIRARELVMNQYKEAFEKLSKV